MALGDEFELGEVIVIIGSVFTIGYFVYKLLGQASAAAKEADCQFKSTLGKTVAPCSPSPYVTGTTIVCAIGNDIGIVF